MDSFLPSQTPAGQWMNHTKCQRNLQENDTKLCSAHTKRKQNKTWLVCRQVAFFVCRLLAGTWILRCRCSSLWRYLMPRCTRTEQQCPALFVAGSPAFCPLTNGSLCAALRHARWQQYCVQAILEPCWAINWFWRKQKWKWGHSHKLLTEECARGFERLVWLCNANGVSCCTPISNARNPEFDLPTYRCQSWQMFTITNI